MLSSILLDIMLGLSMASYDYDYMQYYISVFIHTIDNASRLGSNDSM